MAKVYRGRPYGFDHCVAGRNCNPASHGGIEVTEVRRIRGKCQKRSCNSTGNHAENGDWSPCDESLFREVVDYATGGWRNDR